MKLILIYTLSAGVLALFTAPIPGTSLLLTALEVYMIVHLAKINNFNLGLKEIGYSAAALWGIRHHLTSARPRATFGIVHYFATWRSLPCGLLPGGHRESDRDGLGTCRWYQGTWQFLSLAWAERPRKGRARRRTCAPGKP